MKTTTYCFAPRTEPGRDSVEPPLGMSFTGGDSAQHCLEETQTAHTKGLAEIELGLQIASRQYSVVPGAKNVGPNILPPPSPQNDTFPKRLVVTVSAWHRVYAKDIEKVTALAKRR